LPPSPLRASQGQPPHCQIEVGRDLFGSSIFDDYDVKAERAGGYLNIGDLQYAGWIFNIH
jgi:hypothetical protein